MFLLCYCEHIVRIPGTFTKSLTSFPNSASFFGSVVDHCCAFFSLCDAVIVFVVVEWQEGGDAVVNIQL